MIFLVFSSLRALAHPTMAGIPNSRAIIAAWLVLPPFRVTIREASFIIGSQSGVVISVTRTSPFSKTSSSQGMSSIPSPSASLFCKVRRRSMTSR